MYTAYLIISTFSHDGTYYCNSRVCGAQIDVLFVCFLCPLLPCWIFQALLCWFHAFHKLFTTHHGSLDMTQIHFIQKQKFKTSEFGRFKTEAHVKRSGEKGGMRSEVLLLIVARTAGPLLEFEAVDTTNDNISVDSLRYRKHCTCNLDFITNK